MNEYHKIETLFERDTNGTKKLIEGKFRNEAVEYLANNKWCFTEKIDGTNIRIHGEVFFIFPKKNESLKSFLKAFDNSKQEWFKQYKQYIGIDIDKP